MQIRRGTYSDVTRAMLPTRDGSLSLSLIYCSIQGAKEIILSQPWPSVKYAHTQRG